MIALTVTWNPSPEIFNLFGISIRYYGMMFVISFVLGAYILKKIYNREEVAIEHIDNLFVCDCGYHDRINTAKYFEVLISH